MGREGVVLHLTTLQLSKIHIIKHILQHISLFPVGPAKAGPKSRNCANGLPQASICFTRSTNGCVKQWEIPEACGFGGEEGGTEKRNPPPLQFFVVPGFWKGNSNLVKRLIIIHVQLTITQ